MPETGADVIRFYGDRFSIDEAVMETLLSRALGRGGDFAELFFEHHRHGAIDFEDQQVKSSRASLTQGVGIRVVRDDAIGYAFAVNGELNSADVYASNALFKKLWPKLLKASSTEAFGRIGGEKAAPGCSVDHVAACLSKTGGKETSKDAGGVTIVSRESKEDVVFETRVGAKPLRWNYLTK